MMMWCHHIRCCWHPPPRGSWLSLLSLLPPSLRDMWQHWRDTWHMHQATLAIILTQISPECPCWSDYRAPYLLNQLMNVRRLWRCPPLCHAPGWSLSRQDVASASFGIIITADLAGSIITPGTPGRERDISAIKTDLQNEMLESCGHHTSYNSSLGVTNTNNNTNMPHSKQQQCHFESSGHDSDNKRQDHWNSWMGRTS